MPEVAVTEYGYLLTGEHDVGLARFPSLQSLLRSNFSPAVSVPLILARLRLAFSDEGLKPVKLGALPIRLG